MDHLIQTETQSLPTARPNDPGRLWRSHGHTRNSEIAAFFLPSCDVSPPDPVQTQLSVQALSQQSIMTLRREGALKKCVLHV